MALHEWVMKDNKLNEIGQVIFQSLIKTFFMSPLINRLQMEVDIPWIAPYYIIQSKIYLNQLNSSFK